jgi:hypothetical protein
MDHRNAGGGQHWLVVSYFANEDGLACSHHIDDRLELLQASGISVTLLTSCCVKKMLSLSHLRVCSLSPSGIRFEFRQVMKRFLIPRPILKLIEGLVLLPLYPFYWIEKLVLNIDTTWFWYPLAAIRGAFVCLRSRPKVVYSTGGAISAHLVARFVSRLFGVCWIAEFQDPLIHSYCARSKIEYKLIIWAEQLICATASRVIFLTEKARQQSAARTALAERGVVIYPGAREPSCRGVYKRSATFNFVHVGSLGGSRNLCGLMDAFLLLFQEHKELQGVVRVYLYGSLEKEILEQLQAFPYKEVFLIKGKVSRQQALAEMFSADLLLLIQNLDPISSETIPSKVYEYLHSGRPILGLVYDNDELSTLLVDLGHLAANTTDPSALCDVILEAYSRWQRHGEQRPLPSPYTTAAAVQQLIQLARA